MLTLASSVNTHILITIMGLPRDRKATTTRTRHIRHPPTPPVDQHPNIPQVHTGGTTGEVLAVSEEGNLAVLVVVIEGTSRILSGMPTLQVVMVEAITMKRVVHHILATIHPPIITLTLHKTKGTPI